MVVAAAPEVVAEREAALAAVIAAASKVAEHGLNFAAVSPASAASVGARPLAAWKVVAVWKAAVEWRAAGNSDLARSTATEISIVDLPGIASRIAGRRARAT